MTRLLVEYAGRPWHCGSLQRRCGFIGSRCGRVQVGDRVLQWQVTTNPLAVRVDGGDDQGGDRSAVRIVTTRLPSGGARWWFACPGCGRRCDLLYRPCGAEALACRRCCGLAYASQRTRPGKTPRRRRTRSAITITKTVRRSLLWGRVPFTKTTITLKDAAEPGRG